MKQSPSQERIQENMQEGRFSKHGFLGEDQRAFEEIIREDGEVLASLGIPAKALADRLGQLTQEGLKGLGEWMSFEGFDIRVDEYMGKIPCPYRDHRAAKRMTTIKNSQGGEMTYTDLGVHLIGHHGFFQGKGSEYRLEPAELIKFLGLRPEATPQEIE